MNAEREMLVDTVDRMLDDVLTDECRAHAEEHGWSPSLWTAAETLGLFGLLADQDREGFGGSLEDFSAVARLLGRRAVPAPFAEAILVTAYDLSAEVEGPVLMACAHCVEKPDGRVDAVAAAVPWGRFARHLLAVEEDGRLRLLRVSDAEIVQRENLAGEPRDDLRFTGAAVVGSGYDPEAAKALLAGHVARMAGALEAVLEMASAYACERQQFGRPIGKFQAVQHQLAVMAQEVAAASAAAGAFIRAASAGGGEFEGAAAKLCANRAVKSAVPIAHQVLGAIGFTEEHSLHRLTRRLLAWRSEQGGDRHWAEQIGAGVIERGKSNLWSDLAAKADALEAAV